MAVLAVALAGPGCGGDGDDVAGPSEPVVPAETSPATPGTILRGTVGPGFEIELVTEDGEPVSTLPAGAYRLEVEDLASIHNFRLTGPGVDVGTGVGEEGVEVFDVELEPGSYAFVCEPHAGTLNGRFEVTG